VTEDTLTRTFRALADPTRRGILSRLRAGDATVGELVSAFDLSQPAISKHLKVLEAAHLIRRTRHAQWRSSAIDPEPLRDAWAWLTPYRALWDARLGRLDAHLADAQKDEPCPTTTST